MVSMTPQPAAPHNAALATEITNEWWQRISDTRQAIQDLPFVRGLGEGTLPREAFVWYLGQDALYLHSYAEDLARAAELAPTADERQFWAQSAEESVSTELELHESWIPADVLNTLQPSATTKAYLDQLAAAGRDGDYAELVAAVLPCFWIYADVATSWSKFNKPGHPYAGWLNNYAGDAFAEGTRRAIDIAGLAAAHADDDGRDKMWQAFEAASKHELYFFAAPLAAIQTED